MAIGKIYQSFLNNILNPKYGFGWDLPYYVGNLKIELLTPYHTRVIGTSAVSLTSELVTETGVERIKLSPLSTGEQSVTWQNVTGVARYARLYDADSTTLAAGDPYLMEVDLMEDVYLDDDTFTVFFTLGFITFEGNLI